MIRSDGTHRKRLTDTKAGREFDATFSPNGRKIAFDKNVANGDSTST